LTTVAAYRDEYEVSYVTSTERQAMADASQSPYLMNAILALGASHLTRVSPDLDYTTEAIVHRGKAIQGLSKALTKTNRTFGESDALLASCYALTFQASHMRDGMFDFITMMRGCALVTMKIKQERSATAFNIGPDIHLRLMSARLDDLPSVHPAVLITAADALVEFQHLMKSSLDIQFHHALSNVVVALQMSSRGGYLNFMQLYGVLHSMSHEDFLKFVHPDNMISRLLMAYFICLQFVMAPLMKHEWLERASHIKPGAATGMIEWAENVFATLPPEMQVYLQWPKEIIRTVRAELAGQCINTPPVLLA
jgi:Fungal specific transcription factor domain